jgi:N utilization substance protein B
MISRRNIRVKVMQTLYAVETDPGMKDTPGKTTRVLDEKLNQALEPFWVSLAFLIKTTQYAVKDAQMRASKLLVTQEDREVSTKIADNTLIKRIQENKPLLEHLKIPVVDRMVNEEWVRKIYLSLIADPAYKAYTETPAHTPASDLKILRQLWEQHIQKNDFLVELLSEELPNWEDDMDLTQLSMNLLFKQPDQLHIHQLITEEKRDFAAKLLQAALEKKDYCMQLIQPKLVNWDMERVAHIDLILLRLGLCELLYFSTIPTKVTINEYIEVAKRYSTPQSGQFVNGVLDNLYKELAQEGKIHKQDHRSKP